MSVITNNIQPASGQALTIKDEGGTASITIQTDGDLTLAENTYLGSGKGIYFDGQTGSANHLSDYETGSWTPTYGGVGGDPSGVGYSLNTGVYTKIGDTVHCQVTMVTSSISSVGSGNVKINGLPFTARSSNELDSIFATYAYSWGSNNNPIIGRVQYNQSFITLHKFNTGATATTGTHYAVDAATMVTSASTNVVKGSFTYKI